MPNKLQYRIIHCSDTLNHKEYKASDILAWHTDEPPIGNGWDKAGYNDVIERDGTLVNLIPYDDDEFVDPWEIANGVKGKNRIARHVCLIGRDRFTEAQYATLRNLIIEDIMHHEYIKIAGHCQFDDDKFFCPGFDHIGWLESIQIPEKNILRL